MIFIKEKLRTSPQWFFCWYLFSERGRCVCDCLTEYLMLSAFLHSRWLVFVLCWQVKCKITIWYNLIIFLSIFDTWHQTISRKRYWMKRIFPILDSTIDDALMLSKRFPIFQRTSEAKHHTPKTLKLCTFFVVNCTHFHSFKFHQMNEIWITI